MKKTIQILTVIVALLCQCGYAMAQEDNRLCFSSMQVAPGMQAKLQIQMENANEVEGFQFNLYLPEGVTLATKSNGKVDMTLSERADDHSLSGNYKDDGSYQCVSTSLSHTNYEGEDGTIITFLLNVDESVEYGDYEIAIRNIQLSTNNTFVHYDPADFVGTLSVGDFSPYEDGYSVKILPLLFEEEVEVPFLLANTEKLTSVEFDVSLPDAVVENELYYIDAVLAKTKFTTSINENEGGVHVAVTRRSSNTLAVGEDAEIATLGLVLDDVVAEGIYTMSISNIVMTDVDGNEHEAKPYTADIYVGAPKAAVNNGAVKFNGDYSDEDACAMLMAAMPSDDASVTCVDLRNVTGMPENSSIVVANPNALILTSEDLGLENENNVVAAKESANLSLSDGYPFSSPKPFTAASASYSRTMANDWGTICLPFAMQSDANVQLYELVTRSEDVLVFREVESLEAGEPGVFKRLGKNATITVNASNAEVVGKAAEGREAEGLKLVGSFEKTRVDVNALTPSYYIKDNTFMQGVEHFNVGAFRAYFESNAMAGVKARTYAIAIEDATGVRTVVGKIDAQSGDIYTLGGVKVNGAANKSVFIRNSKKYLK